MSLPLAVLVVFIVGLVGNRILAVLAGLWLRVPEVLMLTMLIILDLVQIPLFYWIYGHGRYVQAHLPERLRAWFEKDWSVTRLGKWAVSLGGFGIMLVAFLPTFGGGIWSAVFLAYSMRLPRSLSSAWISLGSIASYLMIYWVLDTIVKTVRYFAS